MPMKYYLHVYNGVDLKVNVANLWSRVLDDTGEERGRGVRRTRTVGKK